MQIINVVGTPWRDNMYTLFIVDDEENTRTGLHKLFDWAALNIEVVGEADDGVTALPMIERLKPDILLTDVKMAKMDGISLAIQAKTIHTHVRTVFISGYDDVNYVRSALKLGATDYILKPISFKELEACLRGIVQSLDAEMSNRQKTSMATPLLKEQYLSSFLFPKHHNPIGNYHDELLGLNIKNKKIILMIISPDEGEIERCPGFENDWPLLNCAIKNICQELIDRELHGYVFDDPNTHKQFIVYLFFDSSEQLEASMTLCQEIVFNLNRYLKISISICISNAVDDLSGIVKVYPTVAEALKQRLYMGNGSIITLENEPHTPLNVTEEAFRMHENIKSLLINEHDEPLTDWVNRLFEKLSDMRRTDIAFYRGKLSITIYEIYTLLLEQLPNSDAYELSQQSVLERLFKAQTLNQMQEIIFRYCIDVKNLIKLKNDKNTKYGIKRLMSKIREHYAESLSINELAHEVFLTPTYLCVLFKQEVGVTINTFITVTRMEKAKELLQNLDSKLYDISYAVGYSNPSYFSRQFKKYTGMLPSEYRNHLEVGQ